ncbi:MAG: ferritin-like domain-containing protein [Bacillota bacterium]
MKVIKTSQKLEVVKKLETLDSREITRAIRDAIIAELDAIKQYENIVDSTNDVKVMDILQDIANEEKVHVGELQELLRYLEEDYQDFLDEGKNEVKGME